MAAGSQAPGCVHVLTQAGDAHLPLQHGAVGPTTMSRVELVPQSTAATGPRRSSTAPLSTTNSAAAHGQLLGRPAADGVVPTGQVPRQVRVEAFHATARAPDAARGRRAPVARGEARSRRAAYARVGSATAAGGTAAAARRTPPDASSRLTALAQHRIDQPVAAWAWG